MLRRIQLDDSYLRSRLLKNGRPLPFLVLRRCFLSSLPAWRVFALSRGAVLRKNIDKAYHMLYTRAGKAAIDQMLTILPRDLQPSRVNRAQKWIPRFRP